VLLATSARGTINFLAGEGVNMASANRTDAGAPSQEPAPAPAGGPPDEPRCEMCNGRRWIMQIEVKADLVEGFFRIRCPACLGTGEGNSE
jgi:hypothetical protein